MNNEQSIPVQGTETKTLDIEQRKQLIEKLSAEYAGVKDRVGKLHAFLCDIDLVKKVPDPMEQSLMSMQLRSMKGYLDNLRARIMFQEIKQSQEEKTGQTIDDWVNMNGRVNTLCGSVRLINLDEQHHCGQDASCPVGGGSAAVNQENSDSLKDLLGMEVISVGEMPCDACNPDNYAGRPCVKVELVGGFYLCLAPQPGSIITE